MFCKNFDDIKNKNIRVASPVCFVSFLNNSERTILFSIFNYSPKRQRFFQTLLKIRDLRRSQSDNPLRMQPTGLFVLILASSFISVYLCWSSLNNQHWEQMVQQAARVFGFPGWYCFIYLYIETQRYYENVLLFLSTEFVGDLLNGCIDFFLSHILNVHFFKWRSF